MAGKIGRLSAKKGKAIAALISERTVEEAALLAGVSPRTLHRWKKEPEFNAAYIEAKREFFSQSMGRMQQMTPAAVTTLVKTMIDPHTPPATKSKAAESIIHHSFKARELEDIEVRLAELERRAETSTKPNI